MSKKLLTYVFMRLTNRFKIGIFKRSGKNFSGKTCVFHRGGGNKKFYRSIDFFRRLDSFGFICSIIYDPNRSAYIGNVLYDNGFFSFIVLSEGTVMGQRIFSGSSFNKNPFNTKSSSFSLKSQALFSVVSNIEGCPLMGSTIARAAGTGAVIVASSLESITLKLKSGWLVNVSPHAIASVGYISNMLYNMRIIGKAGKNRW